MKHRDEEANHMGRFGLCGTDKTVPARTGQSPTSRLHTEDLANDKQERKDRELCPEAWSIHKAQFCHEVRKDRKERKHCVCPEEHHGDLVEDHF